MICKDCCHYDVCCLRILYNMDYDLLNHINTNAEKCEHFKDKSRIIELPCKVTNGFKEKLTKYCYERCVDEL